MSFNYANLGQQALENLLPMFSSMANSVVMPNHGNFMNHFTSAVTSASASTRPFSANNKSNKSLNSATMITSSRRTPDPPPAPHISPLNNAKANKGPVPMDLENDLESETPTTTSGVTSTTSTDNMVVNMQNANLYLNSLMAGNMAMNTGFMFFPTATATTTTSASGGTSSSPLMDPASIMAAAMQQMQQNYAGYALTETANAIDNAKLPLTTDNANNASATSAKEVIKTKSCILLPPNPNAPPPTIRERPPGCRTVFVGGLPENITEAILREIFESCGEITTLRMSKKNFCHIRFRAEESIDRAIFLSGYRVRLGSTNEPANYGRLHVDYAQARDDQYDYECKQRQLQREQRHRERRSHERSRSDSPPPIPHYSDHEASVVAESLRSDETFIKAIQTITVWLERGDCTKRNANVFYSMIQSTHAHVRRLTGDKQQLEDDLRKARESYRKQMLTMSAQFTQIEKVFSAASHKKVWDHFTKAQRKNIDQWKKLATELRSIQIEDDEMEMSDEDRDYYCQMPASKRKRYESDHLREENDSLRCQLEAIRNEMSLERTDLKYNSEFREKQIKVLQETIRNMQTQLLQTKMREQKDNKIIEQLEKRLKEAGVKQLLLKTKIRETTEKLKDREQSSVNSETSEFCELEEAEKNRNVDNSEIIDIDVDKSDDEVKIVEEFNKTEQGQAQQEISKELKAPKCLTTNTKPINLKSLNKRVQVETETQTTSAEFETKALPLDEAQLIALTTAFLLVQPLGCKSDTICSYIINLTKDPCLQACHLNSVLKKYERLFQIDTNINNDIISDSDIVWKFCGLLKQ
ncbi:ecto-NOX disulfide-thiol exchanger 1 [Glossina fuscipes]|uniref:Ecto-NOX disulfide-thiol exchanger 1 n=1 Tax=Glossina fuscipes TaxID=7396 RepID=A0A8U0W7T2_9MUSC|nr:ecto-NOX disulfide-thiol exchanger 1 [Glossina fuscipes]KAI9588362.1 hypothetical protein GQX74_004207 [Glossina fuscipes]